MAAPGARMRLTVVVEALAEENAHGEFRDMALAAFKERKFAMPVQLDDTFEVVWSDIEQRYKTNYLSAQQAAAFSIKKLQDAYDCDLDMTDTVGAIFEGEPDRKMHLIKVVPHFIYRATSVVPGSMLRPAGAHKRAGDDADDGASKRRRIESEQRRDASPNRPLPSTESQQAAAPTHANVRSVRSQSDLSLLELDRNQTGHTPFASNQVKQEFPPPSHPPALEGTSIEPVKHGRTVASEHTAPEHTDVQESVIHRSPVSSVEPEQASVPAPAKKARKDVYRVPSSPEFMHSKATPEKPARTYGRSPRSGAELLNMARRLGRSTEKPGTAQPEAPSSTTNTARAFQKTQPDESNSTLRQESGSSQESNSHTPVNGVTSEDAGEDLTASFLENAAQGAKNVQTPARKPTNRPVKPGSLKKPSRASLVATPARTNRTIQSKAAATPASTRKSNKSDAEDKKVAASAGGSPKGAKVLGEATMSRMERLDKLLNTSQRTLKRRADANSPAQTGSVKNLQRSHKSSPEVRIPVPKKTLLSHGDAANNSTRPALQSPPVRVTPIQSPVPLPTLKTKTSTPAHAPTSPKIIEVRNSEKPQGFKKPNAKALESPAHSTSLNRPSPSNSITTPKRTEVPLPPNVRHLRRSSSLQSSPLSDGNITRNGSNLSMPQVTCASINNTTPQSNQRPSGQDVTGFAKPTPPAKLAFGSSINSKSPSTDRSNADGEIQHELQTSDTDVNVLDTQISAELPSNTQSVAASWDNDDPGVVTTAVSTLGPTTAINAHTQSVTTTEPPPQMSSQPPSGQAGPAGTKDNGRSSEDLSCTANAGDLPQGHRTHPTTIIAAPALDSDDAGFAEQDIYSTAMEDNASVSRSGSTNASLRSSPAISRRPARFLSHSPTPDASESEGDSDEASSAVSREASPRHDNKGSESESDISSDSSDDDDVETTDLHAKSIVGTNVNGAPASSPPLTVIKNSTPKMTMSQQATPAKNGQSVNRSPIPLPTQHSSQVPGSSQSVSVQAADRRRYTGFRSLREQLADTKAAQTTTQKKAFDPRTMSLGRLIKAKPTAGIGAGEDGSSDDESSSSSSSDDSN